MLKNIIDARSISLRSITTYGNSFIGVTLGIGTRILLGPLKNVLQ